MFRLVDLPPGRIAPSYSVILNFNLQMIIFYKKTYKNFSFILFALKSMFNCIFNKRLQQHWRDDGFAREYRFIDKNCILKFIFKPQQLHLEIIFEKIYFLFERAECFS